MLILHLLLQSVEGENEGASGVGKNESIHHKIPGVSSPQGELLKATPYPIPHPRTPSPEIIQVTF